MLHLLRDGSAALFIEGPQRLLDRSHFGVGVEFVLSEFPRDTRHVEWLPCEDVPVLTEELDERAFLCWAHACPDRHRLAGVAWDHLDGAGVCRCLKGDGVATLRVGLLDYGGVVLVDLARVFSELLGVVGLCRDDGVSEFGPFGLAFRGHIGVAMYHDD